MFSPYLIWSLFFEWFVNTVTLAAHNTFSRSYLLGEEHKILRLKIGNFQSKVNDANQHQ